MNQSQIPIKQLVIIGTLLVLMFFVVFFVEVVYYDPLDRITNKKDHLIECTVVDFETENGYLYSDSRKFYSIVEDADGNKIRLRRTYKDYIGRKVMIYTDESARQGIRKDYEIKKMNLLDYACTIMVLPMIWLEFRMLTVYLKRKKQGNVKEVE